MDFVCKMILETLFIAFLYLESVKSTSLCACATSDTKVYVYPDSDSRIVNTLVTNECVAVLNDKDKWIKVNVSNEFKAGFVRHETIMNRECEKTFLRKEVRSTDQQNWKEWTPWIPCNVTCGGGIRFRFRNCQNLDGTGCHGDNFQNEACSTQHCPIDGSWSAWTEHSPCDAKCGSRGYKSLSRQCSNPVPQYNGTYCQGDAMKYIPCFPECSTTTARPTSTTQKTTIQSSQHSPDTTTFEPTAAFTNSPAQSFKTCDKLGLIHALGNRLRIHHTLASACSDNTFTSPESLVLEYCPMGRSTSWRRLISVMEACNKDIITSQYIPIAAYHFSGLTQHSGIFLGCIPGGFKMALQECGQTAEIVHIQNNYGLSNALDPNNYYIVTS